MLTSVVMCLSCYTVYTEYSVWRLLSEFCMIGMWKTYKTSQHYGTTPRHIVKGWVFCLQALFDPHIRFTQVNYNEQQICNPEQFLSLFRNKHYYHSALSAMSRVPYYNVLQFLSHHWTAKKHLGIHLCDKACIWAKSASHLFYFFVTKLWRM